MMSSISFSVGWSECTFNVGSSTWTGLSGNTLHSLTACHSINGLGFGLEKLVTYKVSVSVEDVNGVVVSGEEIKSGLWDLTATVVYAAGAYVWNKITSALQAAYDWAVETGTKIINKGWEMMQEGMMMTAALATVLVNLLNVDSGMDWGMMVHRHPDLEWGIAGEIKPDTLEQWVRVDDALQKISESGCKYVRLDIGWGALQPYELLDWASPEVSERLGWYKKFVSKAMDKDIEVIAILGGIPSWAKDKITFGTPSAEFLELWKDYCEKVAEEFGNSITYYQILNEENHLIRSQITFPLESVVFQYAYEGLKAGECPDVLDSEHTNHFKTIVNVLTTMPDWEYSLNTWCSAAGDYIDVVAIDHYPGTWYTSMDWSPLARLSAKINDPNDPCYGKEGAIMETGYSSWFPGSEYLQESFINTDLGFLMKGIVTYNNQFFDNKITIGCWYKVVDSSFEWAVHCAWSPPDTTPPVSMLMVAYPHLAWAVYLARGIKDPTSLIIPQERYFGILGYDWSEKVGYDDLTGVIQGY